MSAAVEMLGFGLGLWRRPGDRAAAGAFRVERWIWMELVSDLLIKSAGLAPAHGIQSCKYVQEFLVDQDQRCGRIWGALSKRFPRTKHKVQLDLWDSFLASRNRSGVLQNWIVSSEYTFVWRSDSAGFGYKYKGWDNLIPQRTNPPDTDLVRDLLEFFPRNFRAHLISTVDGGGDKGIVAETIAHPKPSGGSMGGTSSQIVVSKGAMRRLKDPVQLMVEVEGDSHTQAIKGTDRDLGRLVCLLVNLKAL